MRAIPLVSGGVRDGVSIRYGIRRNRYPVLVVVGILHRVAEDHGVTAAALGLVGCRASNILVRGADPQRQRWLVATGKTHVLVETKFHEDGLALAIDPPPARVRHDPEGGVGRCDAVYCMSRLIAHAQAIKNRGVTRRIRHCARQRVGLHGYPVCVLVIRAHRVTKDQGRSQATARKRHLVPFGPGGQH